MTQFSFLAKSRLAISRNPLLTFLLIIGVLALSIEIALLLPSAQVRWYPWDYGNYVLMGRSVREGASPYGPNGFYPLPTILWIFVPLSILPDWFRFIWVLGPFFSILVLFRLQGIPLFLFTPLWFVVGDGMLDGWLLIPVAWLLENRPVWAGVGAALVLFKPQLAVLAVAYLIFKWLKFHDWKNLGTFVALIALFYLPSFILRPAWPLEMLAVLPTRAAHTTTILPLTTGSIWSWWFLGGLGIAIFFLLLIVTLVLFWRAIRDEPSRAGGLLLFNLILNPILFASYYVISLPILHVQREIIIVVLISLVAFALDHAFGFNGYAFIPLTALYFQSRRNLVPAK